MPLLELNGLSLAYEESGLGAGPAVILVAGLADDLRSWNQQVPALVDAGMRVIRFDSRGVAGSSVPPGPYTTADFAADVVAVADSLGVDSFHLVGNSLGGMIAQEVARRDPQRLLSLVLSCTGPECGEVGRRLADNWAWTVPKLGYEAFARDVALWSFGEAVVRRQPEMIDEVLNDLLSAKQTVEGFLNQLHALRHHSARDYLGSLQVPCLVLAGKQDRIFPLYETEELASLIPNADFAAVDGAHACQWEFADEYNRVLRGFLTGITTPD
jgi:3-oxoadipate enol-lactonase